MCKKTRKSFAVTAIFICSSVLLSASHASENAQAEQFFDDIRDPYYIGLGLGTSFLKPETNSDALKLSQDHDFAYRVFGGYQFDDHWAVEVFWADLGQAKIASKSTGNHVGTVKYQSYGIGALYQYPISKSWEVFVTAGAGRLNNNFKSLDAQRVEDNFIYSGAGVTWNIAKTWDLRAEYDYYDSDAQMLSLNIVKRFGSATSRRVARLEKEVQQQEVALANLQAAPVSVAKQKTCDEYSIELKGVVFAKGSVALTDKTKQLLDSVTEKLLQLPQDINFEIRAHTDDQGTELYNYTLSLARARNVRDYIASKGIALSRIKAQGYGEWRPAQSNQTAAGRAANRRAELVLIGLEKYVEDTASCPKLAEPGSLVP
jgi:outer membrane protein OmpA-like peptidoglycan-associated protein